MPFRDLQHFLEALEGRELLQRVRAEVSQDLEISEITDRAIKAGGPALLFENVRGHTMPVAINLFGTHERMAFALDVDTLDRLPDRLGQLLALAMNPPKGGFLEMVKTLPKLMEAASFLPKKVSGGMCKDVVLKGDQVNLDRLPILKCWPQDGGRFITFPMVFTLDPETGKRNVGCYRLQVFDARTTAAHFHPHKDAARHVRKSKGRLQVAAAIGADPAMCFAATLPLPPDLNATLFAGVIRQEPTLLTKCETNDLEVPANAEIVLEGWIDPAERRIEGPFGDHTGYYSLQDEFPVFHVECITMRQKPVYHTIIVGPPPQEDGPMGKAI
jgi:4-hydroxy-3-polyprenylbenzoate decarboxylase